MTNDWFFRAFFEYKHCRSIGGKVYFILLTYDDEHLPYYEDKHFALWKKFGYKIPCFNPDDLKGFRDKFRVYVSRKYGIEASKGIRFFFASEYGKHTGRPHYHMLCYVPFKHNKFELVGTVKGKYTDGLFAKAWSKGFIGVSSKHAAAEIDNPNGISYCMKYVCKRSNWINRYHIDRYYDYISNQASEEEEPGKYTSMLHKFRRAKPRHYQSKSFGACALDYLTLPDGTPCYDKFQHQINLSEFGFVSKYNYDIPRYYYNRLFYDMDKVNEVRYLNEYGLTMKKLEFDKMLTQCQENFKKFYNYSNFVSLSKSVPNDVLLNFLSSRKFRNVRQLYNEIFSITLDRQIFDIKMLALYSKVYRFVNCKDYAFLNDLNFRNQLNFVTDNAFDIYNARFAHNPFKVYPKGFQPACSDINFINHPDFACFSVFDGYDRSLMLLEQFSCLVNENKERYQDEKDTLIEQMKDIYNTNYFVSLSNIYRL